MPKLIWRPRGQTIMRTNPLEDPNSRNYSFGDLPSTAIETAVLKSDQVSAQRCSVRRRGGLFVWILCPLMLVAALVAWAQPADQAATGQPQSASYDQTLSAARAAMERENFDDAIAQANQALTARPEDPAAKALLAQAKEGKQDEQNHQAAVEQARKAVAAGDYEAAVKLLTLVTTGWPKDAAAKQMLNEAQQAGAAKTSHFPGVGGGPTPLDGPDL